MRFLLVLLTLAACSSSPTGSFPAPLNQAESVTAPVPAPIPVAVPAQAESLQAPVVVPTVIAPVPATVPAPVPATVPATSPATSATVPVAPSTVPATPATVPVPTAPVPATIPSPPARLSAIYRLSYPLPAGIQPNGQAVRTLRVATNVGSTGFYGDVPVYCDVGSCFAYWTMMGLITEDVEFVLTIAYKFNNGTYSPSSEKVVWHFIAGTTVMGPNRGSTPSDAPPISALVITRVSP